MKRINRIICFLIGHRWPCTWVGPNFAIHGIGRCRRCGEKDVDRSHGSQETASHEEVEQELEETLSN